MSLYERYKNEAEFRDQFIKPLLSRLGFVGISHEHGRQEFGKDFVFSELDAFGRLRHMIVQAKHEESIGQGAKIDGLISQIRQAFSVPYRLATCPTEERHVSAVYVFNSGKVTDNAKSQIIHSLPKELAANTQVFSGEQLEPLANSVAHRDSRRVLNQLLALFSQLILNLKIWGELLPFARGDAGATLNVRVGILHGLEQIISEPVLTNIIRLNDVYSLWQNAKMLEVIVQAAATFRLSDENRATLLEICERILPMTRRVLDQVAQAMKQLPPPSEPLLYLHVQKDT